MRAHPAMLVFRGEICCTRTRAIRSLTTQMRWSAPIVWCDQSARVSLTRPVRSRHHAGAPQRRCRLGATACVPSSSSVQLDEVEALCLEGNGTCVHTRAATLTGQLQLHQKAGSQGGSRRPRCAERRAVAHAPAYVPDYVRALEELGEDPPSKLRAPPNEHFVRNALTPANMQHRQRNSSSHVSAHSPQASTDAGHGRSGSNGTTV